MFADEIFSLTDGDVIDDKYVNEFELKNYTKRYGDKTYINFVGFIRKYNKWVIVFPKNYLIGKQYSDKEINLLKILLKKFVYSSNSDLLEFGSFGSEIPIKAYLDVLKYYNEFGIFNYKVSKNDISSKGRSNWNLTFHKSRKYINTNGDLLFDRIIKTEKKVEENFISEVMRFVLSDGYNKFGSFFEIGYPFNYKNKSLFVRREYIINALRGFIHLYKKDKDVKLIRSLIKYFQWSNGSSKMIFGTTHFNLMWEKIISFLLNRDFLFVYNELDLKENDLSKLKFNKVRQYFGNDKDKYKYYGEYDHLGATEKYLFLFDSKYYKEMNELNYKQIAYNFLIRDISSANSEYINNSKSFDLDIGNRKIIDGLILPTRGKSYIKTHINMCDSQYFPLKDLIIKEIYLNTVDVLEKYIHYL
jgi:hypothetical protein